MAFVRNYALSIILAIMFFLSWAAQGLSGWQEYKFEQKEHHEIAHIFGDDGYIWQFLAATFENWQSEFFQVFIFVVLSAYFIHKGSPQSRDSDDEMLRRLRTIERLLNKK